MKDVVPYEPHIVERLRRRYWIKNIIGIALITGLVLFFTIIAPLCTATVHVTVQSEHALASVNYVIYIDGDQVAQGTLSAMSSNSWTFTHEFAWRFTGKADITISATSSGGAFGTETDTESLVIANGNVYNVSLTI